MPGRIESYIHSDSTTPNKGGAIVEVICQTDFAAKTLEFANFARKVALMAYATSSVAPQRQRELANVTWKDIVDAFPEMEVEREALSKELKEKISLNQAVILALIPHWSVLDNI